MGSGEAVLGFLPVLIELCVYPVDFLVEQIDTFVETLLDAVDLFVHGRKLLVHFGEAVLYHARELLDFRFRFHLVYYTNKFEDNLNSWAEGNPTSAKANSRARRKCTALFGAIMTRWLLISSQMRIGLATDGNERIITIPSNAPTC